MIPSRCAGEAEDSVDPMVEESGNRLAQGLEELTQAIQQWHVGDVVALATSLVRWKHMLL